MRFSAPAFEEAFLWARHAALAQADAGVAALSAAFWLIQLTAAAQAGVARAFAKARSAAASGCLACMQALAPRPTCAASPDGLLAPPTLPRRPPCSSP